MNNINNKNQYTLVLKYIGFFIISNYLIPFHSSKN